MDSDTAIEPDLEQPTGANEGEGMEDRDPTETIQLTHEQLVGLVYFQGDGPEDLWVPGPDVASLIHEWHVRQRRDYDNLIVIDGEEGGGKSNCGLYLARMLDHSFDPDNIIYNWQDWTKPNNFRNGATLLIDEGGNLGFNRDWNVAENKEFVKYLMQSRQLNQNVIMCIPNFNWLDKYIRNHRARSRIHMVNRFFAVPQEKLVNWRTNSMSWFDSKRKRIDDDRGWSFEPLNVRQVAPVLWNRYEKRKHDASRGLQDAIVLRSTPQASGQGASSVGTASPRGALPLTLEEKAQIRERAGIPASP